MVELPEGESARVAVFGGTFNPFHLGHFQAIQAIKSRSGLNLISVVPASQNPLKPETDGPSTAERLQMIKLAVSEIPDVVVDDQELKRKGPSYTIDTLKNYAKKISPERLFLIIGADQFEDFDRWKKYEDILEIANVLVVNRPGFNFPTNVNEFPAGVQPLVQDYDRNMAMLSTGRYIEFLRLPENAISASEIRKCIRTGRAVEKYLSIEVENFIKENGLYGPLGLKVGDYQEFSIFCLRALHEKKSIDPKLFDLRALDAISEFAIVASGTSTRHASGLAENLVRTVKEEFNVLPHRIEGLREGRWVVLDYGSLIVHVFYDFVRKDYRLEELWAKGKEIIVPQKKE